LENPALKAGAAGDAGASASSETSATSSDILRLLDIRRGVEINVKADTGARRAMSVRANFILLFLFRYMGYRNMPEAALMGHLICPLYPSKSIVIGQLLALTVFYSCSLLVKIVK